MDTQALQDQFNHYGDIIRQYFSSLILYEQIAWGVIGLGVVFLIIGLILL